MSVFLKIRRVDMCAAGIVLSCVALLLIGTERLHIAVAEITVPWAFVIPLLLATAALPLTAAAFPDGERLTTRALTTRDITLRAVVVAAASTLTWTCVLLRTPTATDLAIEVARNVAGMIGIALAAATVFGTVAGGITPLCYFALALCGGRGEVREPHWWAWVITKGDDWAACLLALTLATVGILSPALPRPNQTRRD